jgi:signal transduction histidine kinase
MVLVRDLIELITVPPGDLVYHLVTLFAIQLVLGMAFGHWYRHRRDPTAIRLLVTGIGFVLARALLMLIAVLDRVGVLAPNIVLPPLERFLDFATLLLAVWTFLPILRRHARLGVTLLLLILLVSAGVYAAFAALWLQAEAQGIVYNGYWQETVWEFSSISVLVLALIAGVIWREDDWGLVICLFALWSVGHTLQFTVPFTDSHTAGWVRMVNLAALPLLAGLVYRHVLTASPATTADTALRMANILEAIQRIEANRDIEAALKLAASTVAHALEADTVAVGLPAPGPAKGIRIVALHPPTGAMLAHQEPTLLASRHPLLATALQTGHLQRTRAPHKDPTIAALYQRLGFDRPGPLLVLPLVDGSTLVGVMLAGNPVSQQDWMMHDEQIFQAVGAAITTSLANASRREITDRSAELRKTLGETRRLARRVAELEAELEQQRQRAEELATRLRLREQEAAAQNQPVAEAIIWQEEMRDLAEARAALEAKLAEWKEKAKQLTHSRDDLQNQLAQAQAELQEALGKMSSALPAEPADGACSGIVMSDDHGSIVPEEGATVQSQIAVSLIHELSTPMNSITGYTDLLLGESVGILGEKQRQFLQRIKANIERMDGLLSDLVKVTAIDAGQISLVPEPVDVINVIEDAIMSLSAQFSERELAVQMDMPSELPHVHADRDSLYQIVQHLLSNACQCSEPGTEILISAGLEECDDQVEDLPDYLLVSITDTGGGITLEDQRRVFQRLYRADNPPIAGLGDAGAGLSITKSLVEAQGGRIWVESEMGVGNTFSFIMPLSSEDDSDRLSETVPSEAGRQQ